MHPPLRLRPISDLDVCTHEEKTTSFSQEDFSLVHASAGATTAPRTARVSTAKALSTNGFVARTVDAIVFQRCSVAVVLPRKNPHRKQRNISSVLYEWASGPAQNNVGRELRVFRARRELTQQCWANTHDTFWPSPAWRLNNATTSASLRKQRTSFLTYFLCILRWDMAALNPAVWCLHERKPSSR